MYYELLSEVVVILQQLRQQLVLAFDLHSNRVVAERERDESFIGCKLIILRRKKNPLPRSLAAGPLSFVVAWMIMIYL